MYKQRQKERNNKAIEAHGRYPHCGYNYSFRIYGTAGWGALFHACCPYTPSQRGVGSPGIEPGLRLHDSFATKHCSPPISPLERLATFFSYRNELDRTQRDLELV